MNPSQCIANLTWLVNDAKTKRQMKRQTETRKNIWRQRDTNKTKGKKLGKVPTGLSALFCAPCPASFYSAPPSSPKQSTIATFWKLTQKITESSNPWKMVDLVRPLTGLHLPLHPAQVPLLSQPQTFLLQVFITSHVTSTRIFLLDLLEANCQPAWPLLPFSPPWTLSARELSLFLPGSVICMFYLSLSILFLCFIFR